MKESQVNSSLTLILVSQKEELDKTSMQTLACQFSFLHTVPSAVTEIFVTAADVSEGVSEIGKSALFNNNLD